MRRFEGPARDPTDGRSDGCCWYLTMRFLRIHRRESKRWIRERMTDWVTKHATWLPVPRWCIVIFFFFLHLILSPLYSYRTSHSLSFHAPTSSRVWFPLVYPLPFFLRAVESYLAVNPETKVRHWLSASLSGKRLALAAILSTVHRHGNPFPTNRKTFPVSSALLPLSSSVCCFPPWGISHASFPREILIIDVRLSATDL